MRTSLIVMYLSANVLLAIAMHFAAKYSTAQRPSLPERIMYSAIFSLAGIPLVLFAALYHVGKSKKARRQVDALLTNPLAATAPKPSLAQRLVINEMTPK